VSTYLATHANTKPHIAIVSSERDFALALKRQLEISKPNGFSVDLYSESETNVIQDLDKELKKKDGIAGYLSIQRDNSQGKRSFSYVSKSTGDLTTLERLRNGIQQADTNELLLKLGASSAEMAETAIPVKIDTKSNGSNRISFSIAMTLFLLMYTTIMLYGMNTARSVIEEKATRLFEVMLASASADEILLGKILGVGAVGFTQVTVWMALAAMGAFAVTVLNPGVFTKPPLTAGQLVLFVVYFILGFFLYSSIAAALGAVTNTEQELQPLSIVLSLPLSFCFLMTFYVASAPNSTLAECLSMIPLFSPLLMILRVSLAAIPKWEVASTIALMLASTCIMLWVSSRIYRVSILMYGKRPTLPEIYHWLKYS